MKACVIYRNNDLFAQYVDAILKGHEVSVRYVIPAGEAFGDHENAILEDLARALANQAKVLFVDSTCGDVDREGRMIHIDLDGLFQSQIEKRHPNNTVEDNFAWYARQVVGERQVKKVIVVLNQIADHGFVGSNSGPSRGNAAEWVIKQLHDLFPGVRVLTIATLAETLKQAEDPETLIVLDRHCGIKEEMPNKEGWYHAAHNWLHQSMLYILPFETCASQLASCGKCAEAFDVEEMRSAVQKRIDRVRR